MTPVRCIRVAGAGACQLASWLASGISGLLISGRQVGSVDAQEGVKGTTERGGRIRSSVLFISSFLL